MCATLKEKGYTPVSTAGLNGWHVMRMVEQFIGNEAGADEHDKLQALTAAMDIVGFANYLNMMHDGVFWVSLLHTVVWLVLTVVITLTVSLALALLLNGKFAGRTFFGRCLYLPLSIIFLARSTCPCLILP